MWCHYVVIQADPADAAPTVGFHNLLCPAFVDPSVVVVFVSLPLLAVSCYVITIIMMMYTYFNSFTSRLPNVRLTKFPPLLCY